MDTAEATRILLGQSVRSLDSSAITEARQDPVAVQHAAYIEKLVAEAPPLTVEQRDRISAIVGTAVQGSAPAPVVSERTRQRRAAEAELEDLRHRFRKALDSCAVCGIVRAGHHVAVPVHDHAFTDMRPDEVAQVAEQYSKLIHDAEEKLAIALA